MKNKLLLIPLAVALYTLGSVAYQKGHQDGQTEAWAILRTLDTSADKDEVCIYRQCEAEQK